MIVEIIVYLVLFIFSLKLLWNILTPYIAEKKYIEWRKVGGQEPNSISFATIMEIALLFILCFFYYFSNNIIYGWSIFKVFVIGIILIVASYLIAILVGMVCRYFYK